MYLVFCDHLTKGSYKKCFFGALDWNCELPGDRTRDPIPVRCNTDHHHEKALCPLIPILELIGVGPEEVQGVYHFRNVRKELDSFIDTKIFPSETLVLIVDTVGRVLLNYYVIAQLGSWRRKRNTL